MSVILLKFASPLQSWGGLANYEIRNTEYYPTKSAVIGLVAAAFGYKKTDTESIKKLNSLNFSVRIDQKGSLIRDFQIAMEYNPKYMPNDPNYFVKSNLIQKYYIQDAKFLIALSSDDEKLMEDVYNALKSPAYQLFLGRKSNPINADYLIGKFDGNELEIIKDYEWLASKWYKESIKKDSVELSIFSDYIDISSKEKLIRRDLTESFENTKRDFSSRFEYRYVTKVGD